MNEYFKPTSSALSEIKATYGVDDAAARAFIALVNDRAGLSAARVREAFLSRFGEKPYIVTASYAEKGFKRAVIGADGEIRFSGE